MLLTFSELNLVSAYYTYEDNEGQFNRTVTLQLAVSLMINCVLVNYKKQCHLAQKANTVFCVSTRCQRFYLMV